jgi:hypothetical protein
MRRGGELDLVPVCELQVLFAAYPAVEGHSRVHHAGLGAIGLAMQDEGRVDAPEERKADGEANESDENPVGAQPEDKLDVVAVPAVAQVVGEEAPRVVVVLVGEEDAQTVHSLRVGVGVVTPDQTEVQRPGRRHDGDVREHPSTVVVGQRVDCLEEEGVARNGAHGIIGDASRHGAAHPGGVGQERIETAIASLVEISRVDERQRVSPTSSKSM